METLGRGTSPSLTVCCMTGGRRPSLLAGVLAPLRAVADEIVVAVEAPRAPEVFAAVSGVADTVLAFPPTAPADRPIAWLFRACAGRWIFNVDDDEVPSPRLVAALPELVRRDDITHAWIARRWLHPTPDTAIASPPWGTEFQLRVLLADDRFLQFSDAFHRPVLCHGPGAYVGEPLWHLDTVLNPAGQRRKKAAAYERERPGMRIAGLAHNLGLYVPELYEGLELEPVPEEDRAAIEAALAVRGSPGGSAETVLVDAPADAVDAEWVGPPFADGMYRGAVEIVAATPSLVGAAQATVDVRVSNDGNRTWRWGAQARPQVVLAYRFLRDGREVPDELALRTALPVDVAPGATELVPVHVVPPPEPGPYRLEIDLVHEGVRAFGLQAAVDVDVRPGGRLAVVAAPERLPELVRELALPPVVEPVAILRDAVDRDRYGDYPTVVGPRPYLLAETAGKGRVRTLVALLGRTAALARAHRGWSRPAYEELLEARARSDALVVDSANWERGAAFGREWAWVAVALLLWRLHGKPAVVRRDALPSGAGLRDRAVRLVLRALSRP